MPRITKIQVQIIRSNKHKNDSMSTKNKDSKQRPCKGLPGRQVTAIGGNAISVSVKHPVTA
ncbi:hypothetical protein FH972_014091 [Carpinus fangiana]|uniref:Uncharacterized protein n=1 Tax=Carpinus fangiana TaxID=176857 RepID=A0A5N6RAH3_9ROSI|nr:hypothetical protein FH972_014091 [Carpinus fangiana]